MEELWEWLKKLWEVVHTEPLLTGLISTAVGGLIVLLVWDWRQRGYPILKTKVRRGLILTVLVASISVILFLFSLLIRPQPPIPPLEPINYPRLLKKKIGDPEIQEAFSKLGAYVENSLVPAGKEFCFRDRGVDFRFDGSGVLDTIAFFYGIPGDVHATFHEELPLKNLRFLQTRDEARNQISASLMRFTAPKLGVGNCDEYELKDYRLFLVYGDFDGEKKVQEIRLVKPEDFLHQQAALSH